MATDYDASAVMRDEMHALEKVHASAKARRDAHAAASTEDIGVLLRKELANMAKKYIVLPALSIIASAGGVLGYYKTQLEPHRQDGVTRAVQHEGQAVVDSVEPRLEKLELRLSRAERADTILVDILLKLQVQAADSHDLIAEKLDASSSAARKIDREPESVTNGRTRAYKIKNSPSYSPPDYDPSNPLASPQ